jgi:hypothetical protein
VIELKIIIKRMKVGQEELKGFAVQPKLDCPHISQELADNAYGFL